MGKAKPDRLKKASGKSPTNDWWKIGGEGVGGGLMGDDSIVSGMSDITGLDMNLGLDDIEEFKPLAAIGAPVGKNPVSKINVAHRLQNVEKKIEKEKKNKKKHKSAVPYKGITSKVAEKKLKQAKEAIDWWDGKYSDKNQKIKNVSGE